MNTIFARIILALVRRGQAGRIWATKFAHALEWVTRLKVGGVGYHEDGRRAELSFERREKTVVSVPLQGAEEGNRLLNYLNENFPLPYKGLSKS